LEEKSVTAPVAEMMSHPMTTMATTATKSAFIEFVSEVGASRNLTIFADNHVKSRLVSRDKRVWTPKVVSIRTAKQLLQVFWPNFVEVDGCFYAGFQCSGGPINQLSDGKSETECFINHTHIFDEFRNHATRQEVEQLSDELEVVEAFYDTSHPDFISACEIGREMARMWALKLKMDFPQHRFRVYYTQYDNPIVRFHMVRKDEPVWLTDEGLRNSTESSFRSAVIFDTDYLDQPVMKQEPLLN
jgi:hypothetical protein